MASVELGGHQRICPVSLNAVKHLEAMVRYATTLAALHGSKGVLLELGFGTKAGLVRGATGASRIALRLAAYAGWVQRLCVVHTNTAIMLPNIN